MKTCKEMKELRNKNYADFMAYIERKILSNLQQGFIFIDENEATDKNISFRDSRWKTLLEEAGYRIDYASQFVIPTIKISGW